MTKTIVYLAHPDVAGSSSQQFLQQSGLALTEVSYVDLQAEYEANGRHFDAGVELARLTRYDRVIFQFQLYWYQAPAILKVWLDSVFDMSKAMQAAMPRLAQMEMGLVVIAGVKASRYQVGGREGFSLSSLLSPYYAWAKHFGLAPLAYFPVHQFHYLTEPQKKQLLVHYACYLETGKVDDFEALQTFVLDRLADLDLSLSLESQAVYDQFREDLSQNRDEIQELQALNKEG